MRRIWILPLAALALVFVALSGPARFGPEPQSAEAALMTEVKKLLASDAQADDYFGTSVAISGDTAVVGAYYEDAGGSNAGAAYVFQGPLSTPTPTDTATPTATPTITPTPTATATPCDASGLGDRIWPTCSTRPPTQSSPFGSRQKASEDYRYDWHRGVDIPLPFGSPVYATLDGTVRLAGTMTSTSTPWFSYDTGRASPTCTATTRT